MCATTSLYAVKTKVRPHMEPFMTVGQSTSPPHAARSQVASVAPQHAPIPATGSPIQPARTALIIQDLQNDVMIDGGAFADSGSPQHAREQNVVANVRRLADACRRDGVTVIHVWMVCEPGHPALSQYAPLFQGLKGANALVRGTWGVAPAAGLEPQANDLVVEKMSMSAWETSRLESYLKGVGIDTIISTGAWTNMSVEHTARTAADKGYNVIVPEDACSTMNAEWHRASLDFAMQQVAEVTTVDKVIASL